MRAFVRPIVSLPAESKPLEPLLKKVLITSQEKNVSLRALLEALLQVIRTLSVHYASQAEIKKTIEELQALVRPAPESANSREFCDDN